jgi:hypothetical protein
MVPCSPCLGFGRVPGADNMLVPCAECGGTGRVPGGTPKIEGDTPEWRDRVVNRGLPREGR